MEGFRNQLQLQIQGGVLAGRSEIMSQMQSLPNGRSRIAYTPLSFTNQEQENTEEKNTKNRQEVKNIEEKNIPVKNIKNRQEVKNIEDMPNKL